MTKKILGYALIFVTLFALYQFVNTNRLYDKMNGKIEKARAERDALKIERDIQKDSINLLINENLDLSYFSLEGNGEALEYFEKYLRLTGH